MNASSTPASQSNYDEHATTSTTTTHIIGPSLNLPYVKSIPGIIKIAEIMLSIITFICSIVDYWSGHGWVEFVSCSAFVSTLIYFILTLLNLVNFVNRFPGPWILVEFIYCLIFAAFFLIAAIVAAAYASYFRANVSATAFFAFMATAVFTVDTVYLYKVWSQSGAAMSSQTTTTTAVTADEDKRSHY